MMYMFLYMYVYVYMYIHMQTQMHLKTENWTDICGTGRAKNVHFCCHIIHPDVLATV